MSATRKIGTSTFPAIGFGAMGISTFYGPVESDEERFKVRAPKHLGLAGPRGYFLNV
jgi:hypothetical protein